MAVVSPTAVPRMGTLIAPIGGRAAAEAGAMDCLGDVEFVVSVAAVAVADESGRNAAAKNGSLTATQSKGPLTVAPPETFLKARWSSLPSTEESN